MILFKIVNGLVVDIVVGLILAILKSVLGIEAPSVGPKNQTRPGNVFQKHSYSHWERTILWLEDILESKFSYMGTQVRFLTGIIGVFYGALIGICLIVLSRLLLLEISSIEVIVISAMLGIVLGILGGKSLIERPSIFDIYSDDFKGDNFDR